MKRLNVLCAAAVLAIGLGQIAAAENRAAAPSEPPCTAADQAARSQPKGGGVYLAQITPPPCGNCTLPSGQRGNIVQGVCRVCENR